MTKTLKIAIHLILSIFNLGLSHLICSLSVFKILGIGNRGVCRPHLQCSNTQKASVRAPRLFQVHYRGLRQLCWPLPSLSSCSSPPTKPTHRFAAFKRREHHLRCIAPHRSTLVDHLSPSNFPDYQLTKRF